MFLSEHFYLLFDSLLITYYIAASYDEEYSAKTKQSHGEVDAVLVLVILDQLWAAFHSVWISLFHLGLDSIHQGSNLNSIVTLPILTGCF